MPLLPGGADSLLPGMTTANFWIFFQVLARVSAVIAIAPVFGAREVPAQVKTGMALMLSRVLSPIAAPALTRYPLPTTLYGFTATIAGDAVVGLLIGFVMSLVLSAVQMAASVLDIQVGFSMAQTLNPEIGELSAPLTQLQSMYALLLFLLARGHYLTIEGLAHSFTALPAQAVAIGTGGALRSFTDVTYGMLVDALEIAAPAGAVLLAVDLSFAFVSRAMPQMNVFVVGMPVKSLVGLTTLVVVLPLFAVFVGNLVAHAGGGLVAVLGGFHR